MTSNLGTDIINEYHGELGFLSAHTTKSEKAEISGKIQDVLQKHFRPEFLNRLDEIIIFNSLTKEDLESIVDMQLELVRKRLARQSITLRITPKLKKHLIQQGFDPVYGARPLKRAIQKLVLNPLATALLEQKSVSSAHEKIFKVDLSGEKVLVQPTR